VEDEHDRPSDALSGRIPVGPIGGHSNFDKGAKPEFPGCPVHWQRVQRHPDLVSGAVDRQPARLVASTTEARTNACGPTGRRFAGRGLFNHDLAVLDGFIASRAARLDRPEFRQPLEIALGDKAQAQGPMLGRPEDRSETGFTLSEGTLECGSSSLCGFAKRNVG
jgi:hypothetical protein